MKYLSVDLETTGLSPEGCDILMISAVFEDSSVDIAVEDLPHFTCFIKDPGDEYLGGAFALAMNSWIFDVLSGTRETCHSILEIDEAMSELEEFCFEHFGEETPTLAGKNVAGFDWQFLKKHTEMKVGHRMIDVGSVFLNFDESKILDLKACKSLAGVGGEVAHDAYEDALDVIRCLRSKY